MISMLRYKSCESAAEPGSARPSGRLSHNYHVGARRPVPGRSTIASAPHTRASDAKSRGPTASPSTNALENTPTTGIAKVPIAAMSIAVPVAVSVAIALSPVAVTAMLARAGE